MQEILGVVSGLLVPCATAFYAVGIVRKQIDPAKATWIVWTALSALTAAGMFAESAINYQIVAVAIADLIVLFLAFRYGNAWNWTWVDRVCLALAGVSILLWGATNDALGAIVLLLLATVIGFVPMAVQVWQRPDSERPLPWIIMCTSSVLLLMSLTKWSFASAAQPIVYLVVPAIVLFLSLRKRPALA